MIRVLIAEDQTLVRGALRALLDLEEDLEVVAEVGRGDAVVDGRARAPAGRRAAGHRDARRDGIEAARALADGAARRAARSS